MPLALGPRIFFFSGVILVVCLAVAFNLGFALMGWTLGLFSLDFLEIGLEDSVVRLPVLGFDL